MVSKFERLYNRELCKLYAMADESIRSADRRVDVLAVLRVEDAAMTVLDLASRLDVHPNTVRFHLDKLLAAGRVELAPSDRSRPGRPPQRFRVVPGMDPDGPRHYRLLAEILLQEVAAGPGAASRAESAGRAWGSRLSARDAAETKTDSLDRLVMLLDELGFAPVAPSGSDPATIELTHCPFLELVEIGPGLVCQIHLGLMRGALDAWSATLTADRLVPFAAADRCLAHLARTPAAGPSRGDHQRDLAAVIATSDQGKDVA